MKMYCETSDGMRTAEVPDEFGQCVVNIGSACPKHGTSGQVVMMRTDHEWNYSCRLADADGEAEPCRSEALPEQFIKSCSEGILLKRRGDASVLVPFDPVEPEVTEEVQP